MRCRRPRDTRRAPATLIGSPLAALLAAAGALLGCQPAPSEGPEGLVTGPWRASLDSPGGAITFGMELEEEPDGTRVTLVNGQERRAAGLVRMDGRAVRIDLPPYRSTLVATADPDGGGLVGYWERDAGEGAAPVLPFAALAGADGRPPAPPDPAAIEALRGRWRVRFAGDEEDAVGVFEVEPTGRASGTFLTTLGDYRFLSGWFDGAALRLACFDGAHAFLFEARADGDGRLLGDFWSRDSYHTTWEASKDPAASLPDDFALTRWVDDGGLADLSFPDLDGRPTTLGELVPRGTPFLLVVFGTWCPNCNDLTEFLVELRREFEGIEVVGIAFEMGSDPARHRAALQGYVAHHGIDHPVLLGGSASKEHASAALPILDRVRAYPTTVFLDGERRATAVHTGFSGPATGAAHSTLRERFRSEVESLLAGD